jgi:hypothetical protein
MPVSGSFEPNAVDRRRAAIVAWSAMVGAIMLARLVIDERLSKEILKVTRAALPLKHEARLRSNVHPCLNSGPGSRL